MDEVPVEAALPELEATANDLLARLSDGGMRVQFRTTRATASGGEIETLDLIIADEPTSALDVVTQRQVMQTIGRLQDELGSAVILIGHDMGLMAQFTTRMAVMYAGSLVELGSVQDVF